MPASLCLIAAAGAVSYVFSPPNKNTETNGTDSAFSSDDVVFDYENATDEEINQHNVSLEEGLYSQISSTGLDSDSIDSIMNDPALTPAEKYLRLSELAAINNVDIIDKEQFSNLLPKLKNLSLEIQDNNLSNTVDSFQNLTDQQLKEANHQIKSTVDSLTIALSDPEIATVKSLELFANDIVTSSIDEDYFENEETFAETYMLLASESNNVISSAKLSLNENTSMCWDELFTDENISNYVDVGYNVDVTNFLHGTILLNGMPLSTELDDFIEVDSILYGKGLQVALSIDAFQGDLLGSNYLQGEKNNYFDYSFDVSFSIVPTAEITEKLNSDGYNWLTTNTEYETFTLKPSMVYDKQNSLKLFSLIKDKMTINNSFNISELEGDGFGYSQGQEELCWDLYLDHPEKKERVWVQDFLWWGHYVDRVVENASTDSQTVTINNTGPTQRENMVKEGWYGKKTETRYEDPRKGGRGLVTTTYKMSASETLNYLENGGYISIIESDNVKNNVPLTAYPTLVNIVDEQNTPTSFVNLIPNHDISMNLLKRCEATNYTNNQYSVNYNYTITNNSTNYSATTNSANTGGMASDRDQKIVDQYVEIMYNDYSDFLDDLDDEIIKSQTIFDNKEKLIMLKDRYINEINIKLGLTIADICVSAIAAGLTWITMGASVIDVVFSGLGLVFDTMDIISGQQDIIDINELVEENLSPEKADRLDELSALSKKMHTVLQSKNDVAMFSNNIYEGLTGYIDTINNSDSYYESDFTNFKTDTERVVNSANFTMNTQCLAIGTIKQTYKKVQQTFGLVTVYVAVAGIKVILQIIETIKMYVKWWDDWKWSCVIETYVKASFSATFKVLKIAERNALFTRVIMKDGRSRINNIKSIFADSINSSDTPVEKIKKVFNKRFGGMIRSSKIKISNIKTLQNINKISGVVSGVLSIALLITQACFEEQKKQTYQQIAKIIS